MINRSKLLSDLQNLLKTVESDLISRSDLSDLPEVRDWLTGEYEKAKEAERTANNYEDWLTDYVTQVAAAWVLSCVFARFLEDNQLVSPPRISGPGDALQRARDERDLHFKNHPTETDREYLLFVFRELGQLPGGEDIFGQHNVLNELPNWISGDAAGELVTFFQKIDANSGLLNHDFTDPDWDTRFLGDLYQDLSEKARKKYALLQTPDFVEEFILDRTLEPALDEFGLTPDTNPEKRFKMIDPACGSGHFLLGAFPRILSRWQKQEPGTNIRELVQRTLSSINGVDINPFAIAIARFRLLLAALAASEIRRLSESPAYAMNLACGDSLYHGLATSDVEQTYLGDGDWTGESHYFRTEDADNLRRILQEGTFHAVVANPPYITPKDRAARNVYKRHYATCHMKYSLAVPFMERIFRLCLDGREGQFAGFNGQITSNSFMKRDFGRKLVEDFFPKVDLTHLIDSSGAYLPGHGTPTLIIFGRTRTPIGDTIRTVMGINGEPGTPEIPSEGDVWRSIENYVDVDEFENTYVSIRNTPRSQFESHPWTLSGGGAAELKVVLESACQHTLSEKASVIGVLGMTNADDVFLAEEHCFKANAVEATAFRPIANGDEVTDWMFAPQQSTVFPYSDRGELLGIEDFSGLTFWLWRFRTTLGNRATFSQDTYFGEGLPWWKWHQLAEERLTGLTIAFAEIGTHNRFILDERGTLFNRSANILKLSDDATREDYLCVLGLLNSSIANFWGRQVWQPKGGDQVGESGARVSRIPWEDRLQRNSSKLHEFPIPDSYIDCFESTSALHRFFVRRGESLGNFRPQPVERLDQITKEFTISLQEMIRLQEDLDWECYRLYGLLEDDLTYGSEESLGIQLGERAFEIVMARKMAASEWTTTWFKRHGSQPITELPSHWPDDYSRLVQRRIDIIESNPQIALIEQPEYKRRWNTTPWEEQVAKALKSWLLDRLESYFDFDGRMKEGLTQSCEDAKEGSSDNHSVSAPLRDISLYSISQLANIAGSDPQFNEVASVYRDDAAFDVLKLVEELVSEEHVPMLPVLRYKPPGLRKRAEWEKTWQLQRLEDELRAGKPTSDPKVAALLKDCGIPEKKIDRIDEWLRETPEQERTDYRTLRYRDLDKILAIPVPPKYASSDMISTGGAKYWKLRGKLDVPKERWISFPGCEAEDGSMMICWAGYDHLQQATAIASWYVRIKEELGGAEDPRLIPLLASLIEILPWLKQWHNEIDPTYGMAMGDYYDGFIEEESRSLPKVSETEDGEKTVTIGWTRNEIKEWKPKASSSKKKKASRKKKS